MIDLGGITLVVTGFPRSGTSMMMRMLYFGGIELLYDQSLQEGVNRDQFDPYGTMELEDMMETFKGQPVEFTANKAVKIVTPFIKCLPFDRPLKVIFMLRDRAEIITSMMAKRDLWSEDIDTSIAFARQYITEYHKIPTLFLQYHETLNYPKSAGVRISDFLGIELDVVAMAKGADKNVREQYKNDPTVRVRETPKLITFEKPPLNCVVPRFAVLPGMTEEDLPTCFVPKEGADDVSGGASATRQRFSEETEGV